VSDEAEPHLQIVATAVAALLEQCFDDFAARPGSAVDTHCGALREAYQYPRRLIGRPIVSAHQVAIRRAASGQSAVSDLHTDPLDGKNSGQGSCALYVSTSETSDTAVFESKDGGRAFRVGTMRPGWICALLMDTRGLLHGSVYDGEGGRDMRIITYTLSRVERLLRRAESNPEEYYETLLKRSDTRLQRRLVGWMDLQH
jgi:hypothetical protein